ncbi:unnamed protein product [Pedinophyceae sp. YPF-701]|nr:unnamed protein product [Pedinophyceae sp. YPF-701]
MSAIELVCSGRTTKATCEGFGNGEECSWSGSQATNSTAGSCSASPLNFFCKRSAGYEIFRSTEVCGFEPSSQTAVCNKPGCTLKTIDFGAAFGDSSGSSGNSGFRQEVCVSDGFEAEMFASFIALGLGGLTGNQPTAAEIDRLLADILGTCQIALLMRRLGASAVGVQPGAGDVCASIGTETACNANPSCAYFQPASSCLSENEAAFIRQNFDNFVLNAYATLSKQCSVAGAAGTCTAETLAFSADFVSAREDGNVVTMNDDGNVGSAVATGFDASVRMTFQKVLSAAEQAAVEADVRRRMHPSCVNNGTAVAVCSVQAALTPASSRRGLLSGRWGRGVLQGTVGYDLAVSGRFKNSQEAQDSATVFNNAVSNNELEQWATAVTGTQAALQTKTTASVTTVGGGSVGSGASAALAGVVAVASMLALMLLA